MTDVRFNKDEMTLSNQRDLLAEKRDFTSELLHSFAYSALQSPISGAAQLVDKVSDDAASWVGKQGTNLLPAVQFMSAPEKSDFGSKQWHAQQIGSAAGLAADLIGVALLTRRATPGGLTGTQVAEHSRREILKMTVTGATLGGVFTPVGPGENFWAARCRNASVQGLTFGTLAASTVGLRSLGKSMESAGRTGGGFFRNEVAANVLSGVPAGLVHAQSESLLSGKGLASLSDTGKSIYAFSTVGGLFGSFSAIARYNTEAGSVAKECASPVSGRLEPVRGTGAKEVRSASEPTAEAIDFMPDAPGKVKTVRPDGTIVLDLGEAGSNGTRRIITRTDGTKILERMDGTIKSQLPDGSKVTEFPLIAEGPNARSGNGQWKITERPDGSRTVEYWTGERTTTQKNGTVVTEYPAEGKKIIETADGTLSTEDPYTTVVDVQKLNPLKGEFFREIRTTDKASGETTVEKPTRSRCGEFELVDGFLGRRKFNHERHGSGPGIKHETVEFGRGPLKSWERRSDGTWRKEYREGSIKSEGWDYQNGELMRFLHIEEGANPAIVEAARAENPSDSLIVFTDGNVTHWHQTFRPDGRVETIFQDRAWEHEGRAVSSDVMYPDGSVNRNYRLTEGRVSAELTLANGARISEFRSFVTVEGAPTFEVRAIDGSKIQVRGGGLDFAPQPDGVPLGNSRPRLPLEFDNPRRVGADGNIMQPYDVYDASKGAATRYLYRDGVTITVFKDGRTLEAKFTDGLELRAKYDGKFELKQPDGTAYRTELTRLVELRRAGLPTLTFD